jgi:predicted nucleotide-binding protein (sugar kinase/HSP70/actin superfamily)
MVALGGLKGWGSLSLVLVSGAVWSMVGVWCRLCSCYPSFVLGSHAQTLKHKKVQRIFYSYITQQSVNETWQSVTKLMTYCVCFQQTFLKHVCCEHFDMHIWSGFKHPFSDVNYANTLNRSMYKNGPMYKKSPIRLPVEEQYRILLSCNQAKLKK